MNRPNLFNYATSELSQDAVLCWLLAWAGPEHQDKNQELHQVGTDFINLIFHRHNGSTAPACTHIHVKRQTGRIDVLCIVNNELAIIIEDKTGTVQHSDQLARYKHHVSTQLGFPPEKVIPVYIQSGDQSDYAEVANHGYSVFTRSCLLQILESSNGLAARQKSDTLEDFSAYLRTIESDVQSFRSLPLSAWTSNSWKGFYTDIQSQLGNGKWSYVANPSGGFFGFYWHFQGFEGGTVYLQLEQDKFCFKISVNDPGSQSLLRAHWHNLILSNGSAHGLSVKRPTRFGKGSWMTVAVLDQDYRSVTSNGQLSMPETLETLRTAQRVIDDCMTKSK